MTTRAPQIYHVFRTYFPDNSSFFGIYRSDNPTWGNDGSPIKYFGTGDKLRAKIRQLGLDSAKLEVLFSDGDYRNAARYLNSKLTPATLAHPLCLNMPLSDDARAALATAMLGNRNALGHIKTDDAKARISDGKKRWWHNKRTREEEALTDSEGQAKGFELGRLPKDSVPLHIAAQID